MNKSINNKKLEFLIKSALSSERDAIKKIFDRNIRESQVLLNEIERVINCKGRDKTFNACKNLRSLSVQMGADRLNRIAADLENIFATKNAEQELVEKYYNDLTEAHVDLQIQLGNIFV